MVLYAIKSRVSCEAEETAPNSIRSMKHIVFFHMPSAAWFMKEMRTNIHGFLLDRHTNSRHFHHSRKP
jgi:hypothetical protein